jgi:hypothetical protein
MTGWWFSPGTLIFSTMKTDLQDTTEILLKVALREYDTVAREDNYFAEYRMLFLRRHSNERDIFRGSCIDVL